MKPEITLKPEFVEFIPDQLEERTLYIAAKYRTVVHLCCCGCRRKVVTPLSPVRWKLTFDGEHLSLHPSVGNWSLPCKSHYCIECNKVIWAEQWSQAQIEAGRAAEARAQERYYGQNADAAERPPTSSKSLSGTKGLASPVPNGSFWQRLKSWVLRK